MGTQRLENDYLNIEYLLDKYDPLIKSVYKHFASWNNLFHCADDYEDLQAQVVLEFVKLCREYNPTVGVDFPGYLKLHLQQRVYHFVTKFQRTKQREFVVETREYEGDEEDSVNFNEIADLASEYEFDKVLALNTLDLNKITNKQYKFLIEAVFFEEKTLDEIAAEEGVPVRRIETRLRATCEELRNLYKDSVRTKKGNFVKRKPIFLKNQGGT